MIGINFWYDDLLITKLFVLQLPRNICDLVNMSKCFLSSHSCPCQCSGMVPILRDRNISCSSTFVQDWLCVFVLHRAYFLSFCLMADFAARGVLRRQYWMFRTKFVGEVNFLWLLFVSQTFKFWSMNIEPVLNPSISVSPILRQKKYPLTELGS